MKIEIKNLSLGNLSLAPAKKAEIEKKDADGITAECEAELSDQAKAIAKQESKLAERMDFDCERLYYFSIVFKGNAEREEFLRAHKIKLQADDFVFVEDIADKFKA